MGGVGRWHREQERTGRREKLIEDKSSARERK